MDKSQVKIEALGDDEAPDEKRERKSSARTSRADTELHRRLKEMFGRIAERLEERGDQDLADVIREDADVLAGGLVSFTRPLRVARTVVLGIVAVIEPLLAFWRIGRELLARHMERRERRAREAEAAATGATGATGNGSQ